MSNLLGGQAATLGVLGTPVQRAAALQPATAYGALFTIAGGRVLVTSLTGQVVVATPSTTNTLAFTGTPTSGTAVTWSSATSTASLEAGAIISLGITAGGAVVVKTAGGGNAVAYPGFVANTGTLGITTTGTAATGTIKWTLTYVPLDDGATVVAA